MKIKNLLLSGLMLVSTSIFATPEDAAKVFKKELREDVISYIKAEKDDIVKFSSLINKEFNKEIVSLETLKSGRVVISKKMELTQKEREKLKNIIITLTPEVSKKPNYGPLSDMKIEFDLYD